MKTCESSQHDQIVFNETQKCPLCDLHFYVDSLEKQIKEMTSDLKTKKRHCTCLGTCKGEEGLGDGWICALVNEAMPRPWRIDVDRAGCSVLVSVENDSYEIASHLDKNNAEFIVHVVNQWDALNRTVKRLAEDIIKRQKIAPVCDHACDGCVPGGDHGAAAGFVCAYHEATRLVTQKVRS